MLRDHQDDSLQEPILNPISVNIPFITTTSKLINDCPTSNNSNDAAINSEHTIMTQN